MRHDGDLVGTRYIQSVMADRFIDCHVVIRDEGSQLKNSGQNLSSIAGANGGMGTTAELAGSLKKYYTAAVCRQELSLFLLEEDQTTSFDWPSGCLNRAA